VKEFLEKHKYELRSVVVIVGLILAATMIVMSFVSLIEWDRKVNAEECAKAASVVNASDWKSSGSTCYLVKDGKIAEID